MKKSLLKGAGEDYFPTRLPCGVLVNQEYDPDNKRHKMESCRSICPTKDNGSIEACHANHKGNREHLPKVGRDYINVNSKERLFSH